MKPKTTLILFSALVLGLGACSGLPQSALGLTGALLPAGQSDAASLGSVTVSGKAEVKVTPDEVLITLGVMTFDESIEDARSRNDAIVQRVFNLALDYGVAAKDVQTDYISLSPRYEYEYDRQKLIGYEAYKTIAVTLTDLAQYEDFIAAALGSGVNYIHGVEFRTTQLRQYRDQARQMAIIAAQEKAAALAQALGQEIGAATAITEGYDDWYSSYGRWWGSSWNGAAYQNSVQSVGGEPAYSGGALLPGQISITANVTVVFGMR